MMMEMDLVPTGQIDLHQETGKRWQLTWRAIFPRGSSMPCPNAGSDGLTTTRRVRGSCGRREFLRGPRDGSCRGYLLRENPWLQGCEIRDRADPRASPEEADRSITPDQKE
jgi:hypothetical protein